jgi:exodeoxyribonuclease V alpha subunit
VLRLLLLRLRLAGAAMPTVRVAAPTGKAAQRLLQALRSGKEKLRGVLPADWQPLLENIPDSNAWTVHRLLGFDPSRNVYKRGPQQPLAADIVVVDEASMLDLTMLRALLESLRPGASLILVGDADQLTSIATGSVLADLVAALQAQQAAELVQLTHGFRAERALAEVNRVVRDGDGAALAALVADTPTQIHRFEIEDEAALRRRLREWAQQLASLPLRPRLPRAAQTEDEAPPRNARPTRSRAAERRANLALADLFQAAPPAPGEVALGALRTLARQQLLCALREDRFGALAANALIETELKRVWQVRMDELWYPGRAVIVTRNDYAVGLYNGDVGLCLMDAEDELAVWFDGVDEQGHASTRSVPVARLPAHESAFAITIHKSQGSEYDRVAVLLPPHAEHRVLSRQLLYTGVSRARQSLELWASRTAVEAALMRPVVRVGALADRVRDMPGTTRV